MFTYMLSDIAVYMISDTNIYMWFQTTTIQNVSDIQGYLCIFIVAQFQKESVPMLHRKSGALVGQTLVLCVF